MRYILPILAYALCGLASPAFAVLSIDTQANGSNSAASTVAAGTLTATAGDIIVACMHAEWISSKSNWDTISGVANTPTPLTWAFRTRETGKNTTGDLSYNNSECWWAYTSAGVTSTVITATYNNTQGGFDDASIVVFSVKGFTGTAYHTAPFDQNVALPAIGKSVSGGLPSINVSTSNAATMLFGFVGGSGSTSWDSLATGSGYTSVANIVNGGGTNFSSSGVEEKVVSSTQTGVAVNWTSSDVWYGIADALSQTGAGGGGAASIQRSLIGVGQ